jgi:hypothetical protein
MSSKWFRASGVFVLNILVAAIGTAIVEAPFYNFPYHSAPTAVVKEDVLSAVAAFGLGYFVYVRFRSDLAKWVWLGGLCWFGQRALLMLWRRGSSESGMLGINCGSDVQSCDNWLGYTIPFLRTAFYSVGAWCSSRKYRKERADPGAGRNLDQ